MVGLTTPTASVARIRATTLGLTYSYRLHKYAAADVGVVSTLPRDTEIRGGSYDYKPDERYLWVPFGVRGILPIGEWIEFSVGGGGVYEKLTVPNPAPAINFEGRSGWGGYAGGALAVSVDRRRRIWLSVIPRYYFANTESGLHSRSMVQSSRRTWLPLLIDCPSI